jgi:hypothetical protein
MSSFICNNSHITALAVYAAQHRVFHAADAKKIGDILHAENVRSVNYRYRETTQPSFAVCEWAAFRRFSLVQIIKAAHCLSYQSCEHPDWPESEACKIGHAIISHAAHSLPGYDAAEWEIKPMSTKAA